MNIWSLITIKCLEGNIGENLCHIELSKELLDINKNTNCNLIDKLDFKIKHFVVWKQSAKWEKIFASQRTISRIYKELSKP